jgi:hypothetical protein
MAGKDHDTMRDVLNRLTLKPRMKESGSLQNAGGGSMVKAVA